MYHDVFIAGIGGQGILLFGNLIAEAAIVEGREVTFLPSYGVEMRGGNANCTIVIADQEIGSPSVNTPGVVIAMAKRSVGLYQHKVLPDGLFILNSSLAPASDVKRDDVELIAMPFNDIAADMGNQRLGNMIALGVYAAKTGVVKIESLEEGMHEALSERSHKFIPQNMEAVRKGMELASK